jgi:hypothetical protein
MKKQKFEHVDLDRLPAAESIWSLRSRGSIMSIASDGSIMSIGSSGSILSIGSVGSFASVFSVASGASACCAFSWASRLSMLSSEASGRVLGQPVSAKRQLAIVIGCAALAAAAVGRR